MKNTAKEAAKRAALWRVLRNSVATPRPPAPGTKAITVLMNVKQMMGK